MSTSTSNSSLLTSSLANSIYIMNLPMSMITVILLYVPFSNNIPLTCRQFATIWKTPFFWRQYHLIIKSLSTISNKSSIAIPLPLYIQTVPKVIINDHLTMDNILFVLETFPLATILPNYWITQHVAFTLGNRLSSGKVWGDDPSIMYMNITGVLYNGTPLLDLQSLPVRLNTLFLELTPQSMKHLSTMMLPNLTQVRLTANAPVEIWESVWRAMPPLEETTVYSSERVSCAGIQTNKLTVGVPGDSIIWCTNAQIMDIDVRETQLISDHVTMSNHLRSLTFRGDINDWPQFLQKIPNTVEIINFNCEVDYSVRLDIILDS